MWWLALAGGWANDEPIVIFAPPPTGMTVRELADSREPHCAACGQQVMPRPANTPSDSVFRRTPASAPLPEFALPPGTLALRAVPREPPPPSAAVVLAAPRAETPTYEDWLRQTPAGAVAQGPQTLPAPALLTPPSFAPWWTRLALRRRAPPAAAPTPMTPAPRVPEALAMIAPAPLPPVAPPVANAAMAGPQFRPFAGPPRAAPAETFRNAAVAAVPGVWHSPPPSKVEPLPELALVPISHVVPERGAALQQRAEPSASMMRPADAWTTRRAPAPQAAPALPATPVDARAAARGHVADAAAEPTPAALAAMARAQRREFDDLPRVAGTVHRSDNAAGLWLLRTTEGATYRLRVDPRTLPLADRSTVEIVGTIEPPAPREALPTLVARRVSVYVR